MPDWQGELESLLATLNVSLEGPSNVTPPSEDARATAPVPRLEPAGPGELVDGVDTVGGSAETLIEIVPVDGDEISAVRSEIEATISQVVALVRAGRMDRALRDDVVFVLEALTRPRPGQRTQRRRAGGPDDSGTEWNLASAAAVLRFCRIVLRLTNTLARDDQL